MSFDPYTYKPSHVLGVWVLIVSVVVWAICSYFGYSESPTGW